MGNVIIRKSKVNETLLLIMGQEKVYRVFLQGKEKFNGLDYDKVSDYFNEAESVLKLRQEQEGESI
jgi:hypothetical protein